MMCLAAVILIAACTPQDPREVNGNEGETADSLALSASHVTLAKGQTLQIGITAFNAVGIPISGKRIDWKISDPSVARVDHTGLITAIGAGTATATAMADGLSRVVAVTVIAFVVIQPGMRNTCALTSDGNLFCAGAEYGGLARRVFTDHPLLSLTAHSEPQPSPTAHFCGLDSNGTAYCWGSNRFGELGVGDTLARDAPTPVSGNLTFKSVVAGQHHTCGISSDGFAYCWGDGSAGQLGNGASGRSSIPLRISAELRFAQIESGNFHMCGLTSDKELWCWGNNSVGQLGIGTIEDKRTTPVRVSSPEPFASLAAKWSWTCALTMTGAAYCWGDDTLGQLGVATEVRCEVTEKRCLMTPTKVTTSLRFSSLAVSQFSTCGLTAPGDVYCWGGNMELHFGSPMPPASCDVSGFNFGCTLTPTRGARNFAQIRGSPRNYCGIDFSGIAYCWGGNGMQQMGNPIVTSYTGTPTVFSIEPTGK